MHPPVLTPERIDAMLSAVAEICMAAVEETGGRLKAAADDEAFERGSRSLQVSCRNLRQTIAMKERFDREQARVAVERRREGEVEAKAAKRLHDEAVGRHRSRLRIHFERVLWREYEEDDAQEIFDDVNERLFELAGEATFLDTPFETLVTLVTDEFEIGSAREPDEPAAPEVEAPEPAAAPTPALSSPVEIAAEPAAAPEPEPPDPPPPPPPLEAAPAPPSEPWPEPYIPPWERLRPGQIIYGGSGW